MFIHNGLTTMNELYSMIRTSSYFSKSRLMLFVILSNQKLFEFRFFNDKFKIVVFETLSRQFTSSLKLVVIFGFILSSQIFAAKVEAGLVSPYAAETLEYQQSTNRNFVAEMAGRNDAMMVANINLPLLEITAPTRPTVESAGVVNFIISTNAMSNPGILRVRYDPSEVDGDFLNQNAPLSQEAPVSRAVRFSGSTGDFKGYIKSSDS